MDLVGAKRYQRITQLTGVCMCILLGTIIYVFRSLIAEFYTNIEEVKEETIMLFAFLAVFH
jgi:Na+-driven multidrug efflux pump